MSLGNIFFLDDKWRELLAQARVMEQNSLDKAVLELAVERHLRKYLGEQVDMTELQKPYIKQYSDEIKKAVPNASGEELKKMVTAHLDAVDGLASSLVNRSFEIMDVVVDQMEKAVLDRVGEKLSDEAMDAKIEARMGSVTAETEKAIRRESLGHDQVLHRSDLIRYLSKKNKNGYTV